MAELPALKTIAQHSWRFSLDFNAYLKKHDLLDAFTNVAGTDELMEWRALHYDCYHLLATAQYDPKSPRLDYADTLMLRVAELNARIGTRAFGAPFMQKFLPEKGRQPEVFARLSSPALKQIASPLPRP
jgi:hypothetical protein